MASASPKAGRLSSSSYHGTCSPKHAKYKQEQAGTVFGYSPPPEEPNLLCRDVWRFVQRLDLSTPIKNPRRDFSNGFLAAEMMGRFYVSHVEA
jgi:hypothetical protein